MCRPLVSVALHIKRIIPIPLRDRVKCALPDIGDDVHGWSEVGPQWLTHVCLKTHLGPLTSYASSGWA